MSSSGSGESLMIAGVDAYGAGPGGPGHCFHQLVTHYARIANAQAPPAALYAGYALHWDHLWPAIELRLELFAVTAMGFNEYLERSASEGSPFRIDKLVIEDDELLAELDGVIARGGIVLAVVDTFYLPSFVEYRRVHGMTTCALLGRVGEAVRLWHWENSAEVDQAVLRRAFAAEGNKAWAVSVINRDLDPMQLAGEIAAVHSGLAELAIASRDYGEAVRRMIDCDPPLPDDTDERKILFHVPYRRLADGEFRAGWLLRTASNRLAGARAATLELQDHLLSTCDTLAADEGWARFAAEVRGSEGRWKLLNVLCIRYELGADNLGDLLVANLIAAIEQDVSVGRVAQEWRRVTGDARR